MANAYLIAHARVADNNNFIGEQTGFELGAGEWYSHPWLAVYRANNEDIREGIASFMEKAVVNGFIGYARDESRNTLKAVVDELLRFGRGVEHINEYCSCDCSSLVFTAINTVISLPYAPAPNRAPKTSEYDEWLTNSGNFTKYDGEAYTETYTNLVRGDILLADGHVAVWI